MLILLKDVIYAIGYIAGGVLLLFTVAGNLWLFYIFVETVVNQIREERELARRAERERAQ